MSQLCKEIFIPIFSCSPLTGNALCINIVSPFNTLSTNKDIRIWNAMMKAHGRNGDAIKAKQILNQMMRYTELRPDNQMFKTLINAYSHCGDIEQSEAKLLWQTQIRDNEVKYDDAVCTALVDCYARKGYIEDAHALIVDEYCKYHNYGTDSIHTKAMWFALLSACKQDIEANKDIAQIAYAQINQMEQLTGTKHLMVKHEGKRRGT
eukprot:528358_1